MPDIGASVDRYVIEAVLGEGGMGRVYRALDPRLKRRVALKVLLADRRDPDGRTAGSARMLREARAAAAFNHPNVVAIYDVGEVDGDPYIAMELVDGSSLRTYVGDAVLGQETKREWLLDVARGLGAAHRAGLVHRDIKPDNVMVTVDGVVKILDFGIARSRDGLADSDAPVPGPAPNEHLTPSHAVVGTPQYMAPEQVRGEALDGRTDQFAWGVMAYELLAGRTPWEGATGLAVVAAVLSGEVTPLRDIVPGVDPGFDASVLRALSKSKGDRFSTMEALVEALEGKRSIVPVPSQEDVAFAATTAQPVVSTEGVAHRGAEPEHVPSDAITRRGARVSWSKVSAAIAGVVLLAGAGLAWRASQGPVTTYCFVVADTRDGPRCALPALPEIVAKRYRSTARVVEQGGHVRRVEYVNFAGERLPRENDFDDDDDLRRDVLRGESGEVRAIVTRDANGVVESHEKWSDGGKRVDFVDNDGMTPRHATATERYTTILRDFDGQGRVARERYLGPTGRPRPNVDGVFALAMEYGKTWGARVKVTSLGTDGLPMARRNGVAIVRSTDDEVPGGRESTTYDVSDKPCADNGVFRHEQSWNAIDVTRVAVFGLHDEPVVGLGASVHEIQSTFDPNTHTETYAFKDEHGKPQVYRDRWFSAVRFTQDARGRDVTIESLDADGNRTLVKDGIAAVRCTYDDTSNEIRREHEDPSGAPMTGSRDGYARVDMKKDPHGNTVEERFFDEHGQPAPLREGVAIRRTAYDDRDLVVGRSNFDVNEKPVTNASGWASSRSKYDRMRNLVEVAYFGADGRPTVNDDGVAVQRWSYDDNDDMVGVAYLDASGAPTMYMGDYASKRIRYDDRGFVVEEDFLDVHGDLALQRDGYAAVRRTRDAHEDVILEAYVGLHGEPVTREGGYSEKGISYDERRRPTVVALLDADGRPVVGNEGWATEQNVYDERGLLVRVDHKDALGRPTLDSAGRASWTRTYDARLNVTEEANLGPDGKPVTARTGWATRQTTYDDRDEVTDESLLDAAGELVVGAGGWAIHKLRHDDFGDVIEESFFDGAHHASALKGASYASEKSRYDDRRRLVELAYFDASGVPTKGPDGAAVVRYERDAYGRAITTTYLDGAGVPTRAAEGRMKVRARYDATGRPTEELFVDAGGAPLVAGDGCAGHRMRYDIQGREVERTCVGTDGLPKRSREGWAIRRTLHDARGNSVDESTYDADGSARPDVTGVARTKRRYDERDRLREVTLLGVDGKPAHDAHRVHRTLHEYDECGKATSVTTLDERGHPVVLRP